MDKRLKRLLPIIVVILCGIIYAALFLFTPIRFNCPLRYVTGKIIPGGITCPGCGVTRMLIAELKGDIKAAYAANQAVFILQPFLYFLILRQTIGYINEKDSYMKVKNLIESNFEGNVEDYQEFHALIVEHAKRYYTKRPYGLNDRILYEFKI